MSMQGKILHDRGIVLVFCPNLAVDHIIEAGDILMGQVQHVTNGVLSAGGKGLNVARAARCLGVRATVVGLVGGRIGALLRSLLEEEDIQVLSPHLACETRIETIVHDRSTHTTTVFNEQGPIVSQQNWAALADLVKTHLGSASILICTGSLFPGVSDDGYVDLIEAGRKAGVTVIVDASAETLRQSANARPEIIKVNLDEAELALGVRARRDSLKPRACEAAKRLQLMSGGAVAVTISSGTAFVGKRTTAFLRAPRVAIRNEVGAGDSFLAGLVAALLDGDEVLAACKRAVAVASASVETLQPGHLDGARAAELERAIAIETC